MFPIGGGVAGDHALCVAGRRAAAFGCWPARRCVRFTVRFQPERDFVRAAGCDLPHCARTRAVFLRAGISRDQADEWVPYFLFWGLDGLRPPLSERHGVSEMARN